MVGVAVAALVPTHHPPAGVSDHGGKHVEGAGEVESSVHEEDGRGVLVAPLVGGEGNAVRIDPTVTIRAAGAGIGR